MKTCIILVKPQMGENIGAAARVMANFGFSDLRIVAPRDGWPNEKAHEMAAHAGGIVENARIFAGLEEAVADLEFLYATSARSREVSKKVIAPREIKLPGKTGFVFGPERTGLTNEDLSLCDEIISINVNPDYKSINLAQSVAIICYEISLHSNSASRVDRKLASKKEIISMFEHLESELDKRGFFQEPNKRPGMIANIRNMLARARFSSQEVRSMRGIIKSLAQHRIK